MTSAPVEHVKDRFYVCSFYRPRQNGRSRCCADDDVWITVGIGRCLLWLLWRGCTEVISFRTLLLFYDLLNVVDATVEKLLHRYVVIMAAFAGLDVQPMFWN